MTSRKISSALNTVNVCKKDGYFLEALIKNYHLNLELIKHILSVTVPGYSIENKKVKTIVKEFQNEIALNQALKSLITKKTFKQAKIWFLKMDVYFKKLKMEQPINTKALLSEAEQIFGILNISANKLFTKNKA